MTGLTGRKSKMQYLVMLHSEKGGEENEENRF